MVLKRGCLESTGLRAQIKRNRFRRGGKRRQARRLAPYFELGEARPVAADRVAGPGMVGVDPDAVRLRFEVGISDGFEVEDRFSGRVRAGLAFFRSRFDLIVYGPIQ